MHSISAYAAQAVTLWRNPTDEHDVVRPPIWTRLKAEACYGVIAIVATAEIALAQIANTFSPRYRDWIEHSIAAREMCVTYLSVNMSAAHMPTDPFVVRRILRGITLPTNLLDPIGLAPQEQDHQE